MELDFLFNINFPFSCCSPLRLLQEKGLFPNRCQFPSVSPGLWTPPHKSLSTKFSVAVKNPRNVTQSSFQHDALLNLFRFLIYTFFFPKNCALLLADLLCLSAITYVLSAVQGSEHNTPSGDDSI